MILSERHFAKALVATPTEATSLQVFTRLQEIPGREVLSTPFAWRFLFETIWGEDVDYNALLHFGGVERIGIICKYQSTVKTKVASGQKCKAFQKILDIRTTP